MGFMFQLVQNIPFTLYFLKPGKPDPDVPWEENQERPYVGQPSQKEGTCWYYTANRLRLHIRDLHPPQYHQARKIEKECSLLRKKFTQLDELQDIVDSLAKQYPDHDSVENNAFKIHEGLREDCASGRITFHQFNKICTVLKRFLQNDVSVKLSDFADEYKTEAQVRLNSRFLTKMGVSSQLMGQMKKLCSEGSEEWKFGCYKQSVMLQAYGFKVASWDPGEPISELEENLQHGPLLIPAAWIGRTYHNRAPQAIKTVAGHYIYKFRERDQTYTDEQLFKENPHTIIVVGVEKDGADDGLVYYVDPFYDSHPKHPERERICTISYKSFCHRVNHIVVVPYDPSYSNRVPSCINELIIAHAFYRNVTDYPTFCAQLPFRGDDSSGNLSSSSEDDYTSLPLRTQNASSESFSSSSEEF
jgi:hypothetical protein